MTMDYQRLLPEHDYRFQMGLWKGRAPEFFNENDPSLLNLRIPLLQTSPELYCPLDRSGLEALREFSEQAVEWGCLSEKNHGSLEERLAIHEGDSATSKTFPAAFIGSLLEPDFVLLAPDFQNRFRVAGGAVCFPSWWALHEKVGLTLAETHSVVPGLNAAMEQQIDKFLLRMEPGLCWRRENWGLAATPEFNLHPSRNQPRLTPPFDLEKIWFRIEHQALVRLPRTGAILFGIRLSVEPLNRLLKEADFTKRFLRALQTIPANMAAYKSISEVREFLLHEL